MLLVHANFLLFLAIVLVAWASLPERRAANSLGRAFRFLETLCPMLDPLPCDVGARLKSELNAKAELAACRPPARTASWETMSSKP